MSSSKKINNRAPSTNSTGYGTNSSYSGGRFVRKDGRPNISVQGVSFLKRWSMYNSMLNYTTRHFLLIVLTFYLFVNLVFATIYFLVGTEHLGGIEQDTEIGRYGEAFFFSAQTLSTVGYGHVYPKSLLANAIAAAESILGLLTFAIITGIMYGRFSKPRAYIKFSRNALFAPFKDSTAIMFRLVPFKHNHLVDAEVNATFSMRVDENGTMMNRFFNLPLEISKINALTLSWTLVHAINPESPFYNLTKEDLVNGQAEMLVFVKAFDESFSNMVVSRTSYIAEEFIYGAKFTMMYNANEEKNTTFLHVEKLDDYEKVPLHELEMV